MVQKGSPPASSKSLKAPCRKRRFAVSQNLWLLDQTADARLALFRQDDFRIAHHSSLSRALLKCVPQSKCCVVGVEVARGSRTHKRSFAVLVIVPGSFEGDVLVDEDIHCGKG